MFVCDEHIIHGVKDALEHSNTSQAKVRRLNPELKNRNIEILHCEVCDEVADYQIVPVIFK